MCLRTKLYFVWRRVPVESEFFLGHLVVGARSLHFAEFNWLLSQVFIDPCFITMSVGDEGGAIKRWD